MIRSEISEDCRIEKMPQLIIDYFNRLPSIPNTNFLIAGYDDFDGKKTQSIIKLNVKSRKIERIDTSSQGATWDGETYTLTRIKNTPGQKTEFIPYTGFPHWGRSRKTTYLCKRRNAERLLRKKAG